MKKNNIRTQNFKYKVLFSTQFKKDYKIVQKRHFKITKLLKIIDALANGESLPAKYRDHALTGNWSGCRECHISPDWLLVYKKEADTLILTLTRTGTHSDIF